MKDLIILLKLVSLEQPKNEGDAHPGEAAHHDDPYSVRSLESALGISKTEVNASINRSVSSGLAVKDRESGHAKPYPSAEGRLAEESAVFENGPLTGAVVKNPTKNSSKSAKRAPEGATKLWDQLLSAIVTDHGRGEETAGLISRLRRHMAARRSSGCLDSATAKSV